MAGDAIFTAQTLGADRPSKKLSAGARELRGIILQEFEHASPQMSEVFAHHAPYDFDERDDYHMSEHVEAQVADTGRATMTVRIDAISPESGYNYLGVTRFGHAGPITADPPNRLRWVSGGVTHFARRTAGHHPASDWVENAQFEAEIIAGDIRDRVGREISTRVL